MEVAPTATSENQNELDAAIGSNHIEARIREAEERVNHLAEAILREAELLPGLYEALEISGRKLQRSFFKDCIQNLRASIELVLHVPEKSDVTNSTEAVVYRRFKYLDLDILKLLEAHAGSLSAAAIRKALINESRNKSEITAGRIWNSLNRLIESGSIHKEGILYGVKPQPARSENTSSNLVEPPLNLN